MERVACPHLVGRVEHLDWLERALAEAGRGQPGVLLIAGEAGVGKTRLVEEFTGRACADGALVLVGGCVDLAEVSLPYAPVVEALRGLTREHGGAEKLAAKLGGADIVSGSAELTRLLPELAGALPPPAAADLEDGGQGRLFNTILRLLEALSADAPVVMVLEDLHWADRSTLDLLRFLARNNHYSRALLLGTYRSDELHRRHPLRPVLVELERSGRAERRRLPRFGHGEVTDQITGILGQHPPAELADDVFHRSEGNPFFVEELLAARRDGDGRLPPTLRDILLARLERLPEDAQHVLRVAAAAGPRVDHRLLVTVAGLPVAALLEAVRTAVTDQVLVPDELGEAYTFRHALLQEALYAELLPGERTALHQAFATALDQRPELAPNPAAALAYHWYQAHDLPRALAAAVEAGFHDKNVYAFSEAQQHLERAMELWAKVPDPEAITRIDEMKLLAVTAAAAHLAGDFDRAIALVTRALELLGDPPGDPLRAGLLRERLGRYRILAGRGGALDAYERALALVPREPSPERARVLAAYGSALMLDNQHPAARTVCEEAIEVARQVGAKREEGSALNSLGVILAEGFGEVEVGIEYLRESRRIAESDGGVEDLMRAWNNLAAVTAQDGRLEDALAITLEGIRVAEGHGLARTEGTRWAGEAAEVLIALGRWDEAERLLPARQPVPLGANKKTLFRVLVAARLHYLRGGFDQALRILAESRRSFGSLASSASVFYQEVAAEVALWRDRPQDARAAVAAARGTRPNWCDFWPLLEAGVRAEADLAVLARARSDDAAVEEARATAQDLIAELGALHEGVRARPPMVGLHLQGVAELTRLAGRPDPDAWARAAAHWEACKEPPRTLYARWRQAEALVALDTPRRAVEEILRPAADAALQLGFAPLTERLEALARRARITLDSGDGGDGATAAAAAGLTRRETEVLELVAAGRSNRQIGTALFISTKTASVHVSNILAKLGVASRLEAAAAAHRLGLLPTDGDQATPAASTSANGSQ